LIPRVDFSFFHNIAPILKGKLAIICIKKEQVKKLALDLKLIEEREVYSGNQKYFILVFKKAI